MAKSTCKHRAASVDEGLQKSEMDLDTPSKSRKASVFGSLEKVFNMLTPKKQSKSASEGPRKVKVSEYVNEVCLPGNKGSTVPDCLK